MVQGKIKYEFSAKLWRHQAEGGWHFVSLPGELSNEIRSQLKWQEEGWGRMKALAKIGELQWETAIWFDSKKGTYILPVKAEIRAKSNIEIDQILQMSIWL